MRANVGMLNNPMASVALRAPGPQVAASMMAVSSAGKAKATSVSFRISDSVQPRCCAASRPMKVPMHSPKPTAPMPTSNGLRAPASNWDTTSRPSASVPSQCLVLGLASRAVMSMSIGGCGVQNHESRAQATSKTVRQPPAHNPGCRMARWRSRCAAWLVADNGLPANGGEEGSWAAGRSIMRRVLPRPDGIGAAGGRSGSATGRHRH